MAALVGLLAKLGCKPRQDRKVATVVADACAGEVLARAAAFLGIEQSDCRSLDQAQRGSGMSG